MKMIIAKCIMVTLSALCLDCFGQSTEPKFPDAGVNYRITYSKNVATNADALHAIFTVENLSERPISVPHFRRGGDGVALGTMLGFRVWRDGEWVNPGWYFDGVSTRSVIKANEKLPFLIVIPTNLIKADEKFKFRFGSDLESPVFIRSSSHRIIEVVY